MDIGHLKLGKGAASHDKRTLKLSDYSTALPLPPTSAGYMKQVATYPMFGNDTLGDCVPAAMAHAVQRWTKYAGKPFTPELSDVISAYSAIGGYVPGDSSTDNGCDMLAALKYWQSTGIAGHKIAAYVAVDATKPAEIMQAVKLFGACFVGVQLPITAQSPVTGVNGLPCWALPRSLSGDGAPGSWGGHCIDLGAYGFDAKSNKGTSVVTWGQVYDATWDWLSAYADEAYAVVTQDFIEADAESPSGFDIATLTADLKRVTA